MKRYCPICQQVDESNRHAIANQDPRVANHMDCCATYGCPDGSCDILVGLADGKQNAELQAFLTDPANQPAIEEAMAARTPQQRQFTTDDAPIILEGVSQ